MRKAGERISGTQSHTSSGGPKTDSEASSGASGGEHNSAMQSSQPSQPSPSQPSPTVASQGTTNPSSAAAQQVLDVAAGRLTLDLVVELVESRYERRLSSKRRSEWSIAVAIFTGLITAYVAFFSVSRGALNQVYSRVESADTYIRTLQTILGSVTSAEKVENVLEPSPEVVEQDFADAQVEAFRAEVDQLATEVDNATESITPRVIDLLSLLSDFSRLEILGAGFGSRPGTVILEYWLPPPDVEGEPQQRTLRSTIVQLTGRQIEQWTDDMIVVVTNDQQQRQIRESLGLSIDDDERLEDIIPYLQVITDGGLESDVW